VLRVLPGGRAVGFGLRRCSLAHSAASTPANVWGPASEQADDREITTSTRPREFGADSAEGYLWSR
jgi:hypothetical protein